MIYLKISIPLKVKVDISLEIFSILQKHLTNNMKKETLTYINLIFLKIIYILLMILRVLYPLKHIYLKNLQRKLFPKLKKKIFIL